MDRQGPRNAKALLLPAGKTQRGFPQAVLDLIIKGGLFEAADYPFFDQVFIFDALDSQAIGHIFKYIFGKGIRFLKNHSDATAQVDDIDRGFIDILTIERYGSFHATRNDEVVDPVETA